VIVKSDSEFPIPEVRQRLLSWFNQNKRSLPWRTSKDPYHIWLSEVILQQTRVDQGLPYFERFIVRFPTVEDLASADLDEILKLWEGLGYYSRARNLHKAAQQVVSSSEGILPSTYDEWILLPGIGPYTAAAISSIAFAEKRAVLDGNVMRVLSRIFAVESEISTSQGKRESGELAELLLNPSDPGTHNEAMMEAGALICLPRNPTCHSCPFDKICVARSQSRVHDFPVKRPSKKVPHYDIAVGIIRDENGRIFIQRRPEDAMLGGLWEFPGGKRAESESLEEACLREIKEEIGVDVAIRNKWETINHAYSHFRISLHAFECRVLAGDTPTTTLPSAWVAREELSDYAFPRANRRLLEMMESASAGTRDAESDYHTQSTK